jgi:hypothetical protein
MLFGHANLDRWSNAVGARPSAAKRLELGEAKWLQFTFEASNDPLGLFPAGLHPTIPVLLTMQIWDVTGGDLGPFRMAQVRASCRAGIRIRALHLNSVITSAEAGRILSEGWGYRCTPGEIATNWRADRIEAEVKAEGGTVLQAVMRMPLPVAADDLQHVTNANIAKVDGALRVLQVEPDIRTLGVQRGTPELKQFDAHFWNVPDNAPRLPVIAAAADIELSLDAVRFTQDPAQVAQKGTQELAAVS